MSLIGGPLFPRRAPARRGFPLEKRRPGRSRAIPGLAFVLHPARTRFQRMPSLACGRRRAGCVSRGAKAARQSEVRRCVQRQLVWRRRVVGRIAGWRIVRDPAAAWLAKRFFGVWRSVLRVAPWSPGSPRRRRVRRTGRLRQLSARRTVFLTSRTTRTSTRGLWQDRLGRRTTRSTRA